MSSVLCSQLLEQSAMAFATSEASADAGVSTRNARTLRRDMAAGRGDPAPPLVPKGGRPCRLLGQANGSASTLPVELPRRQRPPRAGGSGAAAAAARLQRRTSTAEAAQSVSAPRAATAPRPATPPDELAAAAARRDVDAAAA
ncbi:hypothetical protein HPB52_015105 [Rhipicephalus sanguineus]|uniref:Uncharacterized protein n=1 Tax=Rhipicephalus sanguineus TaxID=34632 RepID=A0A9D4SSF8_RHISA|nr:hypothetical protein HPB52_015105 [Rhipicephalus sanguineus]